MAERPLFLGGIAHAPQARTFAEREVFFLTRMSSEKTIKIISRLRARKSATLVIFAGGKVCDAFDVICGSYFFADFGAGESSFKRVKPKMRAPPMTCIAVMLSPSRVTETRTATRGSM